MQRCNCRSGCTPCKPRAGCFASSAVHLTSAWYVTQLERIANALAELQCSSRACNVDARVVLSLRVGMWPSAQRTECSNASAARGARPASPERCASPRALSLVLPPRVGVAACGPSRRRCCQYPQCADMIANALAELQSVVKLVLLMPSWYSLPASVCGPLRGGQSVARQAPLGVHPASPERGASLQALST